MEQSIIKMISSLMSGMTFTESVSLISIVVAALVMGAKGMSQLTEFIKKTSGDNSSKNNKMNSIQNTNNEQILIQLSLIRDRLLAIETKQNNVQFEMPKELSNELQHLFKKIEDGNLEHITSQPNNSCLDHKDLIYTLKLENEQVIHLRPIRFKDTLEIAHLRQNITQKIHESGVPDMEAIALLSVKDLVSVIEKVDTKILNENKEVEVVSVTDRAFIEEWARSLKKKEVDSIISHVNTANEWGFNLSVNLKCRSCEETYSHNLELDPINFFSG